MNDLHAIDIESVDDSVIDAIKASITRLPIMSIKTVKKWITNPKSLDFFFRHPCETIEYSTIDVVIEYTISWLYESEKNGNIYANNIYTQNVFDAASYYMRANDIQQSLALLSGIKYISFENEYSVDYIAVCHIFRNDNIYYMIKTTNQLLERKLENNRLLGTHYDDLCDNDKTKRKHIKVY